jgi:hypothetical protein
MLLGPDFQLTGTCQGRVGLRPARRLEAGPDRIGNGLWEEATFAPSPK